MLDRAQSVIDVFNDSCVQFADKPAFTGLGRTLSYRELDQLSGQFAAFLQHHTSLQPGDRIAVQLPNVVQYPVVIFGALRAGLTVVNTNPLYTAREIEHQLCDSGAKALVVLANIADTATKVIAKTPVETVIVTELADLHSPVKRILINSSVKYIKKMVPAFRYPNQISFLDAMAKGRGGYYQSPKVDPQDTAILQYTGGTTGVAKGVMLTHSNLTANMEQAKAHMDALGDTTGCVYVAPLPLYHIYAFTVHCMCLLKRGDHNLLIANPRDIPMFIKTLKNYQMAGFVGVNTLFNALCRDERFHALNFSTLKVTVSGGMALTAAVSKRWCEVTGCEINEGFGLTEASPLVAINPMGAVERGTVGLPLAHTEVKIIDESGETVPNGEPGELCIRGPQVMKGYWNRPEETRAVLDEQHWLKTGDMAVLQDNGYLRIVDRKKDMIIVSGFNVYPNEIEDVVTDHPDIVEAAAIGIADENSGEAVKLFVVSNSQLTEASIREYCREQLTAYKVPKVIEFRQDLPKSNVGKILRRELK